MRSPPCTPHHRLGQPSFHAACGASPVVCTARQVGMQPPRRVHGKFVAGVLSCLLGRITLHKAATPEPLACPKTGCHSPSPPGHSENPWYPPCRQKKKPYGVARLQCWCKGCCSPASHAAQVAAAVATHERVHAELQQGGAGSFPVSAWPIPGTECRGCSETCWLHSAFVGKQATTPPDATAAGCCAAHPRLCFSDQGHEHP